MATTTDVALHRLDAETYGRIVASGALDDRRVELIDGLLVDMSPNSPEHAAVVRRLTRHLAGARGAVLAVQLPLDVAGDSVPEPDLALVAEPASPHAHPRTARLVVEVAVTSARLDRGRKAQLYAAAGVPEYWVVDVPGARVEVGRDPRPDGYAGTTAYDLADAIPSPAPGVPELLVAELLAGLA